LLSSANVISALEFNPSGEYLASGDYGGSISIYKKKESVPKVSFTLPLLRWL
jgi:WD40 repeat protein